MIKNMFIGCLLVVILSVLAGGAAFWFFFVQERPQLTSVVDLPPLGLVGKPVEMVVQVTNPHTKPVTLDSIDVESVFLAGFEVGAVTPKPLDETDLLGQTSWEFKESVGPGKSFAVRFELIPQKIGYFTGLVDVCNTTQDYSEHTATIEIQAPAE